MEKEATAAVLEAQAALPAASETERKLLSFLKLKRGWFFRAGCPPEPLNVLTALRLLRVATENGFEETDAFPGAEGEVQFTLYKGDTCHELTVLPNRTVEYIREVALKKQGGRVTLSEDAAKKLLELCPEC